jgi:myo-inositol-1(or 4)-monophosphatase
MRKSYLELFKNIAEKIEESLNDVFGTNKAKEEFEQGAFGDTTVYIDKIAEEITISTLKQIGFECSVLTEETGWVDLGAKLPVVIVDPIDGSLNAKRGLPYFSFSIALSEGLTTDNITVGYVKNLSNKDEFYAVKGSGAYFNGAKIESHKKQLNVVAVEGLKKRTNSELVSKLFKNFNKVRQMGSVALDICYCATGAFDAFINVVDSRVIDYAAAKLILEESGGAMYRWIDNRLFVGDISKDRGGKFFCVANREMSENFINIMV